MPNNEELNTHEESGLPVQPSPVSGENSPADDMPGLYGALKCYFFTPKRGDIWGSFCFLFDGASGEAMEKVFWVTRSLVGPAIDVNMHWKSLNKLIPQMGVYEKSLGDKLSVLMYESFSSAERVKLCRDSDSSENLAVISNEIRNVFERATHCFLEFKMAFELMSKQELTNAGVLTKENDQSNPEGYNPETDEKPLEGALLNCQPMIDPVHGKPVSELAPDDLVEVKIQGGVGAGQLIHKYLASTNQDAVFPIETVDRSDPEKTYIILKINDEIKGIITATKDLRIRVLNVNSTKKTSITLNVDNLIFFGVLAVAIVVILFVVRYLLF